MSEKDQEILRVYSEDRVPAYFKAGDLREFVSKPENAWLRTYLYPKAPRQKPGESEQVVQTPREFLDAVEKRFGLLDWDLAATRENSVCGPTRCYTEHTDSLKADWEFDASGPLWLNPPFGKVPTAPKGIANWVKKASETVKNRVLVLVPASVGAKWFKLYVHNKCLVLSLSPRLTFVGHESCYPKDLMLCCYNVGEIGFKVWDWKQ